MAQRVRPEAMTVAVILAGLLPIMLGYSTGSEIMQRIAAPMTGGMISAPAPYWASCADLDGGY